MDSFSEFVKHRAEDLNLSQAFLLDWLVGWRYAQVRAIKIGTLKAAQISFEQSVDLARVLEVSVDDLAEAAALK